MFIAVHSYPCGDPDPSDMIKINGLDDDSSVAAFILRCLVEFPKLCACGKPIRFSSEDRCENCFALNADRWHGRSQRVKTHYERKHERNSVDSRQSCSR